MQTYGKTATFLPTPLTEGTETQARVDKYGGMDVLVRLEASDAVAMEGAFYVARATPAAGGAAVAGGIQVSFSDTANIFVCLQNAGATKTILPQYIKGRICGGNVGTSTTSVEWAIETDSTNRYSSGGTVLTGLTTNPSASSPTTGGVVHVGAVTATAAGTGRNWASSALLRNSIPVINDEYTWVFGLGAGAEADTAEFPPTTVARITIPVPPVAVPPTGTMLLHLANVGNVTTAPSYEWEIGWIER